MLVDYSYYSMGGITPINNSMEMAKTEKNVGLVVVVVGDLYLHISQFFS